jgi:hypothetical protein
VLWGGRWGGEGSWRLSGHPDWGHSGAHRETHTTTGGRGVTHTHPSTPAHIDSQSNTNKVNTVHTGEITLKMLRLVLLTLLLLCTAVSHSQPGGHTSHGGGGEVAQRRLTLGGSSPRSAVSIALLFHNSQHHHHRMRGSSLWRAKSVLAGV